jgi:hypothetical protein
MKSRFTLRAALALIILLMLSALSRSTGARNVSPSSQPALSSASLPCNGGLSGSVIASDTAAPLEAVTVTAYLAGSDFTKSTDTDAAGQYAITGLPVGQYRVRFDPTGGDQAIYVSEYFNNQLGLTTATSVAVSMGAITPGINAALDVGGTISGSVTGADTSAPLSDVVVDIYTSAGDVVGEALTDASGAYTTDALRSGSYTVEFLPPDTGPPYIEEFFNNAPNMAAAAPVSVTAPGDTPSINAALDPGGQIRGRVTAVDGGAGLADVAVLVFASDGTVVSSASTDGTGNYATPGLHTGNYKLRFDPAASDTAYPYLEQYYSNKSDRASADLVAVTLPNPTTVNVTLNKGGQFIGKVTATGTGSELADVEVLVYTSDGQYVESTFSDTSGDYVTPGVATGNYKLLFDPAGSATATGYAFEYHNNKPALALADVVAAPAPNVPARIDAVLDIGGRISGKLTLLGADLCGNAFSVTDAEITVYDSGGQPVATTEPDATGNYTTPALPAGSYRVGFDGPIDTCFDPFYYKGQPNLTTAALVSVTAPNTTPNIDAQLTCGGKLYLPYMSR